MNGLTTNNGWLINKAGGYYGDERERTNRAYNLDILDPDNLTNDFWQMPIIENNGYIPNDLIGFNYAKTSKTKMREFISI